MPTPIEPERTANHKLIAAAGTAAQEVEKMGYDPVETIEHLPELLQTLSDIEGNISTLDVEQMRGLAEAALALAEGSDDS